MVLDLATAARERDIVTASINDSIARFVAWHASKQPGGVTRTTMVYGVDKPIPGVLTGVPTGATLTDSTDTTTALVISSPGTYRRQRFLRRVDVRSRGVRFEECEFTGGPTAHTSDHGLLQVTSDLFVGAGEADDVQVIDCTFRPRALGNRVNGFLGWHTRFERCDFTRVVDPFGVHGFNWWTANGQPTNYPAGFSAKGCTWHDLYFDAADYQSDGYTHNDGVQIQGGDNGVVLGCWGVSRRDPAIGYQPDVGQYTGGRTLSNILIQANVGTPTGWVIDRNWFDAAHLSINISTAITALQISGNRFDGTASGRDINSDMSPTDRPSVLVYDNTRANGTTVNVRRGSTSSQDTAPTAPAASSTYDDATYDNATY